MASDYRLGVVVAAVIIVAAVLARRAARASAKKCGAQCWMRKLWYDHVARTRLFLKSLLNDLPDLKANEQYLMANQSDLAAAIVPSGGPPADTLTSLLREHISLAGQIAESAKKGEPIDALSAEWGKNADEIAKFLAFAGFGKFEDLSAMMRDHLALTAGSVKLQLAKQWAEDDVQFSKIVDQAMRMADMLSTKNS